MEAKTAVIIGSVALLGVGAFIYFKPKAISTAGAGTTGAGTSSSGTSNTGTSNTGTTNVPPTETVLTTPQEVIELAKKIAEAKDLATKISDLRNQKNNLTLLINAYEANPSPYFNSPEGNKNILRKKDVLFFDNKIKDLNEQIGKLGYMEVNGGIVKIL